MRTLNFPLQLNNKGLIVIATGLEALRQKINQRLLLFQDTWFLDSTAGVPYMQEILKKPVDPGLIASIFNSEILKESEVVSIGAIEASLDAETRSFDYKATIRTIFGTLNFEA